MALLRSVGIPCRLHGTQVVKGFQRSIMPKIMAKYAPPFIVHTWAEVYFGGKWLSLEGVITDKAYIAGLKRAIDFSDFVVLIQIVPFAAMHKRNDFPCAVIEHFRFL